jgi:hypothetical protein
MVSGGDAKAQAMLHWPLGSAPDCRYPLWMTEGERKGDVLYHHYRLPTVAIPGVSLWSKLVDWGQEVGNVVLAMDNDDAGRKCEQQVGKALVGWGVEVQVAKWDDHKGIDDALCKGATIRLEEWKETAQQTPHPQPKRSVLSFVKGQVLKDHQIVPYLQQYGPLFRNELCAYNHTVSELIRKGVIRMTKTDKGQLLEAL